MEQLSHTLILSYVCVRIYNILLYRHNSLHAQKYHVCRMYRSIIILLTHQYDRHEDEAPFKCKRSRTSPMSSITSLLLLLYPIYIPQSSMNIKFM